MEAKLELLAKKEFNYHDELYQLVDFLNKSLKKKGFIFGLSKEGDKALITIYET
ncbi:YpmA family protein [Thermosediminibacter litoriperuensis]|uniref:Uncharacterized protein DUF4264 n=1 Tax=Thermosediminibacter litoriperuensis TaxID=291989 RepID=A0A5S5B199_9FIRM|nr:YpmA family protein [Thermosediminibacter litoriperuensis]TYP59853.1 uncharacterized protein DUF4264 [Thermosediminibacter litoriperuensis]